MSLYFAKDFKYKEIECPCCEKIRPIDPKLIYLLQSLRDKIDRPIFISRGGGIRCKKYNKRIRGYYNSAHLLGRAVDISAKNMGIIQLAKEARKIGFSRIGIYPENYFIHIDTVRLYRSASWVKFKNKDIIYYKTLELALEALNIKRKK